MDQKTERLDFQMSMPSTALSSDECQWKSKSLKSIACFHGTYAMQSILLGVPCGDEGNGIRREGKLVS